MPNNALVLVFAACAAFERAAQRSESRIDVRASSTVSRTRWGVSICMMSSRSVAGMWQNAPAPTIARIGKRNKNHGLRTPRRITHDARPLHRITIFHPEVKYPKHAVPYGVLPDDILQYFHLVFEKYYVYQY